MEVKPDTREMICDRCRRAVPIPEIRFESRGADSKTALCNICRKETKLQEEKIKLKAEADKRTFFCGRCRYKFKFDPTGVSNLKCPYCGKADKVELNNPRAAGKIIKEAAKREFF